MYTYTAVNRCVFRADSNESSEDLQITLDGRVLYANVAAWTNVQSPAMLRESAQRSVRFSVTRCDIRMTRRQDQVFELRTTQSINDTRI